MTILIFSGTETRGRNFVHICNNEAVYSKPSIDNNVERITEILCREETDICFGC